MSSPLADFSSESKGSPAAGSAATAPRLGQVYLDVIKKRLHFLNETAEQMRADGVPFTKSDLGRNQLHSADGRITRVSRLPLVQAWHEGRPLEATFQLFREGHSPATIWWSAAPYRDNAGTVLGVFGSVCYLPADPDRHSLAGLVHDLRTPLHALNLLADVLEKPGLSATELRENLADLRATLERALKLGADLLDLTRGSARLSAKTQSSWFALEPVLSALAREQTPAAQRKGLTLGYDGAPVLGWEIFSDAVRFGRLLSNLLENAVRYTPSGSVAFTASWRTEPTGKTLALSVVDTGMGISDEEQESIFEPFERGKAGKDDDSGGSGLGLAVVDRLVEELELELEVYSEFGRGSAFHLLVPWRLLRSISSAITTPINISDTHPELRADKPTI